MADSQVLITPNAPDFSKIWASNSPLDPYSWSDSDYLTGWNVVGQTPPAREQFDALQNLTDKKLKYLFDTKAPLDSPTFTGTPKAPTPAKNDNSTRIATTAWARQWISELQNAISDAQNMIVVSYSSDNIHFVKFKNRLVIQAWYAGGFDADSWNAVNLPMSYIGAGNYLVVATATLTEPTPIALKDFTSSSFKVKGTSGAMFMSFGYV